MLYAQINNLANLADTLTKGNLKLSLAERRSNLVLHHLHTYQIAKNIFTILDGRSLADIQTYRSIEFQGITTGSRLRVAKHDTNLITQLVDEDTSGVCLADGRGELAESLAHQTSLKTYHVVTHVTLDFLLWSQRCYRVNHQNVDGRRTDQLVCNL